MNCPSIHDLFYELADHPKLSFGANNTGCEARADLMAEIAEARGHEVTKIWITPSDSTNKLPIYLNRAKSELAYWNYHVAIAVKSKTGEGIASVVIDPSLFSEPVDPAEWTRFASIAATEYDYQALVTESPRNAYFGPHDIVTDEGRVKALARREETLTKASNMDDPVVFNGHLMKRRGDFVDEMMRTDPEQFQQLQSRLIMSEFRFWFRAPLNRELMIQTLNEHPRYYGINSAQIMARVDFTEALASFGLKKEIWAEVGRALEKLVNLQEYLITGPASPEAQLFRALWKDDDYRAKWFSPFCEKEWRLFGLDPERLASP